MSADTQSIAISAFPAPSEAFESVLEMARATKMAGVTQTLEGQIKQLRQFGAFLATPAAQSLGPTDRIHLLSETPCGVLPFRNAELTEADITPLHTYLRDIDVASLMTSPCGIGNPAISIALAAPLHGEASQVTAWSKLLSHLNQDGKNTVSRLLFMPPMNRTFAMLAQHRDAFLAGTTTTSRRTLHTIMNSHFMEQAALARGSSVLSKYYREFIAFACFSCGEWAGAPRAIDHFVRLTAIMPALVAIRHVTPPFEHQFCPEDGIISALHCASWNGCGQIFDALSEEEKRRVGQYLAIQGGYQPGLAASIDLLTVPNGTAATLAKLMILGADAKYLGEAVDSTAKLRKLTAAMGSEMTLKIIPHLKSRLQKAVVDMSVTGGTDMENAT